MKKFFNWKELFEKYSKYKKVLLHIILTERNVGKTYATYADMDEKNIFIENRKGLIFRNTDKELVQTKRDFANRYKNKLIVQGDFIYDIKWETLTKDGEEINVPHKNKVVGYFASINNYINYKSIEAKDIVYIMYEEFNEDTVIGRNIYFKFINILKTFERFNKLERVVMLGNKDGFDSDYFVNWNILPSENPKKNQITEIKDDQGIIGVVYDFGSQEFKNLKNKQTLSNRLAAFDARTNNYANGSYLKEHSKRVINCKLIIPTFKPEFYISIKENRFIFGNFENGSAILSPWNYEQNLELVNYSFDVQSSLIGDSIILEQDEHIELMDFLFKKERANELYYDSYDSRNDFRNLIMVHKRYLQK